MSSHKPFPKYNIHIVNILWNDHFYPKLTQNFAYLCLIQKYVQLYIGNITVNLLHPFISNFEIHLYLKVYIEHTISAHPHLSKVELELSIVSKSVHWNYDFPYAFILNFEIQMYVKMYIGIISIIRIILVIGHRL